jgi:hypothetical protein
MSEFHQELVQAFMALHLDFQADYGALWSGGRIEESERLAEEWIDALLEAGVDARAVRAAHGRIKREAIYTKYPPKRREFIALARQEMNASAGDQANAEFVEAVRGLCRRLAFRYGVYWGRREAAEELERADYWATELADAGIDRAMLRAGEGALKSDANFAARPPTLDQFIGLCLHAAASDHGLPAPERAYQLACGAGRDDLHPVVRIARSRVGAHYLRVSSSERTRAEFLRVYREVSGEYLRGTLDLEVALPPDPERTEADQVCDTGALLALLGELGQRGASPRS